ncbi:biotin-dependent carboxyltransferase family protein [Castellaniella sp.]|uniref:5-oxoprolinase subunit C family protein n=1 Tax=Castellaniella sp. TaxID=1955812 RepID=UPI003564F708
MSIDVLKSGALSQLQDLGRWGWQRYGVVVAGAMDPWSHRCANALVGNADTEATLEMTLVGPSLRFRHALVMAICGADLAPRIGSRPVPLNRALVVRAGAQLDFGPRRAGVRAYLAVRGGFAVAPQMGSRSTHVRSGLGGLHGRALEKGDVLPVRPTAAATSAEQTRLERADCARLHPAGPVAPRIWPEGSLRVMAGPQWGLFGEAAQAAFVGAGFRVEAQSDRMGLRLFGPALQYRHPFDMISEGVTLGTIQVPPDGQPILLMADRQTTGGYPKIAHVASVDLPRVAQCAPGEVLRFESISLAMAQHLYLQREQAFARWRASL